MDTHKQVELAQLQQLRAAIDADDVAKLQLALGLGADHDHAALGVTQTPYALVYDDDYDAGYIIEGEGDAGYLVFDVTFLDGGSGGRPAAAGDDRDGDGNNNPSPEAPPRSSSSSSSSRRRSRKANEAGTHGMCTCAHYAALHGAPRCLEWLLSQPGGRAVLGMAHHSGRSLEEMAEDPRVLELLVKIDAAGAGVGAAGAGAAAGAAHSRTLSAVATDHDYRVVNQLGNAVRKERAKVGNLLGVVDGLRRTVEGMQGEMDGARQRNAEQSKALFQLRVRLERRRQKHQASLDAVEAAAAAAAGATGTGSGASTAAAAATAACTFFAHMIQLQFQAHYRISDTTAPLAESWLPAASGPLPPKQLERTAFFKIVGPRTAPAPAGTDPASAAAAQAGRIQPINFNAAVGAVEGANGVAFRAVDRLGRQIVVRGMFPEQPYRYSHGRHPNLLSVQQRFRGSSSLVLPWVAGDDAARLPAEVDYAVVEFFPSVLASWRGARLGTAEIASVLAQVALGLGHLERACGVQHNDVHERHVFVTPAGFLKLGGLNRASLCNSGGGGGGASDFILSDTFRLGQLVLRLAGDKPARRFAARADFAGRPHAVDNVPRLPVTVHPVLRDLVSRMLDWRVEGRPSLDDIVAAAGNVLFGVADPPTTPGSATAGTGVREVVRQQKAWLLGDVDGDANEDAAADYDLDAGVGGDNDPDAGVAEVRAAPTEAWDAPGSLAAASLTSPLVLRYLQGQHLLRRSAAIAAAGGGSAATTPAP